MSTRTLFGMATSVVRALGGAHIAMGEVYQALYNANKEVHSRYEWPWLYTEYLIPLNGTYSTGTLTLTDGSTSVTGTGTSWSASWTNRSILVGMVPYRVSSFGSATTATLLDTPSLPETLTDVGYTMFDDLYDMPADYEPGSDVSMTCFKFNPVKKIPLGSFEEQNIWMRTTFASFQTYYCDAGFNDSTQRYRIKVSPAPSADNSLRFVYRRMAPDLTTPSSISVMPESFAQCIEFYAEVELRRTHLEGKGLMEAEAKAQRLLSACKRRITVQPITNRAVDHGSGLPGGFGNTDSPGILRGWGPL